MARPDLSAAESILHNLDKAVPKAGDAHGAKPKVGKAEAAPAPKSKTKGPSHTASNFKHTRTSPRGK
jgi:hypothetical protein